MLIDIKTKTTYQTGIKGEKLVQLHYQNLGFNLLANRYKTKFGEIDLVMIKENLLIFIEVKARKKRNANFELINKKQIIRNCHAARIFISHHLQYCEYEMRFDFALVVGNQIEEIIESAWFDET